MKTTTKKSLLIRLFLICFMALMLSPLAAFADESNDGNVAKIGEQEYATLQAAVDAAKESETVALLADFSENVTIPATFNGTLDLNDCQLGKASSSTITIAEGANLTIIDTGAHTRGGIEKGDGSGAAILNNGTVTVNGGHYNRTVENYGVMTIKKGGFSGDWETSYIKNEGTLTIENGQFKENIKNGSSDTAKISISGGYFYVSADQIKDCVAEGFAAVVNESMNGKTYYPAKVIKGNVNRSYASIPETNGGSAFVEVRTTEESPAAEVGDMSAVLSSVLNNCTDPTVIAARTDADKYMDITLVLSVQKDKEAAQDTKEKVEAAAENADGFSYLNIDLSSVIAVNKKTSHLATGVVSEQMTETIVPMQITVDVPDDIPAVKDGYTRTYQVIRCHEYEGSGLAAEVLPTTESNGRLTFETNLFCDYAVAYTDTENEEENPTEQFVTRLYQVCLERTPDTAGLNYWVAQLKNREISGAQAASGFVFSEEFKNKNYCNEHFVRRLYSAFMGRDADENGLSYWVNRLETGTTREEVFNGFALSNEFNQICQSYGITQGQGIAVPQYGTVPHGACSTCGKLDGVTEFVTRMYTVCLNRQPDAGGLNDWCSKLWNHTQSGADVARGFIFSKELTDKNLNSKDFVEVLYKAFMGRDPDTAGWNDWTSKLNSGTTRQEVFNGFVGSTEFDNLCKKYGIVRG